MCLKERIERDRQAFVYAMFGLRTLYNTGSESASVTRELYANFVDEPAYLFPYLPRTKMNPCSSSSDAYGTPRLTITA